MEEAPRTSSRLAGNGLLNSNDPHSLITKTNDTERSLFNQNMIQSKARRYAVWPNQESGKTE